VLHIDGSKHSGSGTVLRYAAALATLKRQPLHIYDIRAKRDKPGLRPQHLMALRACAELSSGRLEGDQVNSKEIFYWPGGKIRGGEFVWDIGTAGSSTMLAFTLIAPALYAESGCSFSINGGLFQDLAPSAFHMQEVLLPMLRRMGAVVEMEIVRPGYVPKGQGCLRMSVQPLKIPLKPVILLEQGKVLEIRGISLSSHLSKEKVSERMAGRCNEILKKQGYVPRFEIQHDASAVQRGAALILWAITSGGCILGADQAGKRGRSSESIAEAVCTFLLEDLSTKATTDRHLADQLILFAALAEGTSEYRVPRATDHVQTNLWLVNEIFGVESRLHNKRLAIDGIGL
jgi:RNA 3'-terminal phosphate cyclase (ATP)